MKKKHIIHHPYNTGNPELDQMVKSLVERAGGSGVDSDLIEQIIITALKLQEDGMERGDMKLLTVALKELRYAFKVFMPYRHVRKAAIFGSARTKPTHPDYKQAVEFSKKIAAAGWMVVTGAASGIMSAGNEGAGRAQSFGVNIRLPFEQDPNPIIANDAKLINFKYFFTRKLIFIRESDATVLFPGGFGTHDEGFETLTLIQTGKASPRPIVCIDPPKSTYWSSMKSFLYKQLVKKKFVDAEDLGLIYFTHSTDAAVKYITRFYHNYHSSRYIDHRLVIRIKSSLTPKQLAVLNKKYKSILSKGSIEQFLDFFPEEENEPHTHGYARLAFYFNRRHFAKLMQLIDDLNNF